MYFLCHLKKNESNFFWNRIHGHVKLHKSSQKMINAFQINFVHGLAIGSHDSPWLQLKRRHHLPPYIIFCTFLLGL
jgi:hypothetical protein